MIDLPQALKAMAEEDLGAWLFFNFRHRDPLADRILSIPRSSTNTRPWLYLLPGVGEPLKIVHCIEPRILDSLPGAQRVYGSRAELLESLGEAARNLQAAGGRSPGRRNPPRTACHYAPDHPALSYLDHGTALLLQQQGFRIVPADTLIQRFLGTLSPEAQASHERAARALYRIVERVWERVRRELGAGAALKEATVQGWMLRLIEDEGLVSRGAPLVAAGAHSGDPHYSPDPALGESGWLLERGAVLQLDLWGKERSPGSVYADISWVGVLDHRPSDRQREVFAAVTAARDLAVSRVAEALARHETITGAEVDRAVRDFLAAGGFGAFLKHRTGHAIDEDEHGVGVNLDSVEFPDTRRILEGSCFSVEPGVYLPEFGMRSEIDVYVSDGRPVVSGGQPQRELLLL